MPSAIAISHLLEKLSLRMTDRWMLRAVKWARNPPSPKRVKFVFGIIAVCIIIYLVERYIGLPDWMSIDSRVGRRRLN